MNYKFLLPILLALVFFQCESKVAEEAEVFRLSELDSIVETIELELAPLEKEVAQMAAFTSRLLEEQDKFAAKANPRKFITSPTGVVYNPEPGPQESSVYISTLAKDRTAALKEAYSTEILDSIFSKSVNENPVVAQVFYNTRNQVSRVFPSYSVETMLDPALDVTNYNFYYLADEVRNPKRGPVWIEEVYIDPVGRGWVLSLLHPVYHRNQLHGVLGVDITVNQLIGTFLDKSPKNLLIVDENGTIVAGKAKAIQALHMPPLKNHTYIQTINSDYYPVEDYNLFKSKNKEVRQMISRFILDKDAHFQLVCDGKERQVFCKRISLVNWYLIDIDLL